MTAPLLLLIALLLSSCTSPDTTQAQDKIDLTKDIQDCTVFYDHFECTLTDGKIYYADKVDIMLKTTWDKSAWAVQE